MPLMCHLTRNGELVDPDPNTPGWSHNDLSACFTWAAEEQGLADDWKLSDVTIPHTFKEPHDQTYYEDNRRSDPKKGATVLHTTVLPGDVFHAWRS